MERCAMFRYLSRWERAIGRQLRRVLGAAGGWVGRGRPRSPTSGSIACGPVDPELAPVVRLGGDLRNDEAVAGLYRQVVRLVSAGLSRVVVDLQGVVSADSRLVATLVNLHRRARAGRVALELHVSQRLRDWIRVYRADWLLSATKPSGSSTGVHRQAAG